MERSVVKDIEIKVLLKEALTTQINDRALFMKPQFGVTVYKIFNLFCPTIEIQPGILFWLLET